MATQTWRMSQAGDGLCWVEVDYNDTNDQATLARWNNGMDRPVNCKVTLPNGKVVFDDTLAIGASGTFTLSGGDRFNITTQSPAVNLAPWATPTSP